MKFLHRIGIQVSPERRQFLEELGLRVPEGVVMPGGGDPLVAFDIDESHPNWRLLQAAFEEWDASDIVSTVFSKKEVSDAQWLNLASDWHHGYPQPDDDIFGYRQATYDLTNWCERCGIGMKQNAPFQMKGEPKWGKRSILQLNWVFDEYFVTPDVWAGVFEPKGIDCRPVVNTKGGELKTVVQLVTHAEVGIVTKGLLTEEAACSVCGRTKYLPVSRGPFPALMSEPSSAMVRTKEYFGSGAAADKGVLVSRELAHALIAGKVRGVSLQPVAES